MPKDSLLGLDEWVETDKFDSFQKIIENIKNIIAKSEIM